MTDPPSPPVLTLSELRRRLGRSQAELATTIGTTQSGVSRIEHQSDMHVSTLNEYVSALGGRLRLVVEHGDHQTEIGIPSLREERPEQRREFQVIWQDKVTRSLVRVGWLVFTGHEFKFLYTDDIKSDARFRPFPAFRALTRSIGQKSSSRTSRSGSPVRQTLSTRLSSTLSDSHTKTRRRQNC